MLADCDPSARVPSCPDWNAADLLWHLAEVQGFWAKIVRTARPRPTSENDEEPPSAPESYDGLLAAFDDYSAALVTELERGRPGGEAWTGRATAGRLHLPAPGPRGADPPARRRARRRRSVTPLDPELADDGVPRCSG